MLSEEKKNHYVETGGLNCPYCGSGNIYGDKWNHGHDGVAWQWVHCDTCRKDWRAFYVLSGIEEAGERAC